MDLPPRTGVGSDIHERTKPLWEPAEILSQERAGDTVVLVVGRFQNQPLHVLRDLTGADVQVVHGESMDTYLSAQGEEIEVLHMPLEEIYLALSGAQEREEVRA